jgi:aryl-phospho-beta-D-glucosidase BglC (GH1 family)
MNKRNLIVSVIITLIICFPTDYYSQGYLHRLDKKIVNGAGQEVLLKGIGLGGWLVQEGYMLHTSNFANAQWEIKAKITDLIGEANTEVFYQTYRNNYVKRADIDSLNKWGFNSVRLPMHYNLFATNTNPPVFLDLGFEIIDSLLAWCESNQIYLILDMHAAPGGQSANNISDYNPAYPSLWESSQNKNLTVQIWRKIAERYKDKEWIGGYDLLNEPAWNLGSNSTPLRDLYIRLTDTIRAVDNNHLIFIEGNWFATDFNGLTPPWDENMSYSFHKYWNGNTQSSIQYLIDLRNSTNRPLWLGETGENSNKWFTDCVELMKTNNIGWAWWPHKKIESIAGPLSAYLLPAYQTILNYWSGTAPRPSVTYAYNALMAQGNALLVENCKYQKDVVDALIRQPNNNNVIPFSDNLVPGIVNATDYDLGKMTYAYNDFDFENTGDDGKWNNGWNYRNDGVDIETCSDFLSNGYNVGWIENGEWLKYTINVMESGTYKININVAAPTAEGKILLSLDGTSITPVLNIPATGGWQNWQYLSVDNIYLSAGVHTLQTRFFIGKYNFSYMDFVLLTTNVDEDFNLPLTFELLQNYPNPFNPVTEIKFSIPQTSDVELKVFDIMGNEVVTLVDDFKTSGTYSVKFDGKDLTSGVYFYRLQTENFLDTKKLLLLK